MGYSFKGKRYSTAADFAMDRYLSPRESLEERKKKAWQDFLRKESREKRNAISHLLLLSYPADILVYKAGEILNPFRTIRINRRIFSSYQELGESRLSTSPGTDPVLRELVHHNGISEHRRLSSYRERNRDLYKKVKRREKQGSIDLQYAYFSLGYLLSGEKELFFKGKKYRNIFNLTYYLLKENKAEEYGSYFSNSPLLKVYSELAEDGKQVEEFLHLCKKREESEEKLNQYLRRRKK